jgi:hypothetical protein
VLGGELVLCLAHAEEHLAIVKYDGACVLREEIFECHGDLLDHLAAARW